MADNRKSPRLQRLGWLLGALALFSLPATAVETAAELEATREAMRSMEREQQQRLREIERLEERVAEVARRSQDLRADQRRLAAALEEQDRAVNGLEHEVEQRERDLALARAQSRQLMRGQWLRERHRGWVPADARMARHHRILDARVQARREQALVQIARQVEALTAARDQLATARDELLARETEARRVLLEIARQEEELVVLLVRVQQRVESDALEMERLERNARTLETVVQRMEVQAATAASAAEAAARENRFAARRGSLPFPVNGGFLHRYGSPRGGGLHAQWRGEVFDVGDDAAVRAVHPGQTVYADWMRGYGFLVILDHGEGYLSLYGNNRELLTRQGEQVPGGALIARAGATSSVIAPGLYFELRHQGRTLNPGPWWDSK
jgi:murein hydrolase activator